VVTDFKPGVDKIDISDGHFGSFASVSKLALDSPDGVLLRITDHGPGESTLFLDNIRLADLSAGDFILL